MRNSDKVKREVDEIREAAELLSVLDEIANLERILEKYTTSTDIRVAQKAVVEVRPLYIGIRYSVKKLFFDAVKAAFNSRLAELGVQTSAQETAVVKHERTLCPSCNMYIAHDGSDPACGERNCHYSCRPARYLLPSQETKKEKEYVVCPQCGMTVSRSDGPVCMNSNCHYRNK